MTICFGHRQYFIHVDYCLRIIKSPIKCFFTLILDVIYYLLHILALMYTCRYVSILQTPYLLSGFNKSIY